MNAVLASSFSVQRRSSFRMSSCLCLQKDGNFGVEVLSVGCDKVTWEEIEPWMTARQMLLEMCRCKGVDGDW